MNARRLFLQRAGLAAAVGATLLQRRGAWAAALPLDALPPALAAAPGAAAPVDAGWHVDDMWGPRYAEVVPYQHDTRAPDLTVHAHPADHNLIRGC